MQKFALQVQTALSQRLNSFSACFIAFLKCTSNLKHFETKDKYASLIISQTIDSERGGY